MKAINQIEKYPIEPSEKSEKLNLFYSYIFI